MKKLIGLVLLVWIHQATIAQLQVAITIDDVPNTRQAGYSSKLLAQLDQMNVPATIFINESKVYSLKNPGANVQLLADWIKAAPITLGNHTFSHLRYSKVGLKAFQKDITRGAHLSKELGHLYKKDIKYFRFPYNDLGNDSLQHQQIKAYLKAEKYTLAPFTIESSDWMFSYLYEYYLEKGKKQEAVRVGKAYVKATLDYFTYFENLANGLYKRPVSHIYLCHDNPLNADYLPQILSALQARRYGFISLEEALKDEIYAQKEQYYKKWGVSWIYRWIKDTRYRSGLMNREPNIGAIFKEYQKVSSRR
ncbi:hypothetical protein BKI52_42320 [marine bacterium AO1-C]|nr:hypothetical protein BKI52_42320 [marine bacterium AO1-C]